MYEWESRVVHVLGGRNGARKALGCRREDLRELSRIREGGQKAQPMRRSRDETRLQRAHIGEGGSREHSVVIAVQAKGAPSESKTLGACESQAGESRIQGGTPRGGPT